MNEINDSSFVEASTIRWSNKFSNQEMAIVVCPIRFHDFKVPMKRNVLLSGTSLQRRTFADFSQVRWTYCFEIH